MATLRAGKEVELAEEVVSEDGLVELIKKTMHECLERNYTNPEHTLIGAGGGATIGLGVFYTLGFMFGPVGWTVLALGSAGVAGYLVRKRSMSRDESYLLQRLDNPKERREILDYVNYRFPNISRANFLDREGEAFMSWLRVMLPVPT
eukprot:gnl/Hemi2/28787_TR9543_c0_g6_i1.p1 gnl/Hemi2/28787_TR9543_c0_g6~~gnl/Hemi2/28787_TR9543_c0_g6_i1.p1  ORF type:complete len:162 (-),score=52.55 gnl/Hemi2/28787_TR9543_c0_g6_i1:119-562(-)